MADWKPMATAPRDGTEVRLRRGVFTSQGDAVTTGAFDSGALKWMTFGPSYDLEHSEEFTGWQPLEQPVRESSEVERLTAALAAMTAERDAADLMRVEAQSRMRDFAMALRDVAPGPHAFPKDAEDYAAEVEAEIDRLRAQVCELELPPVVPRNYLVCEVDHEVDHGEYESRWELWEDPVDPEGGPVVLARMLPSGFFPVSDPGEGIAPDAVLGLIYANRHGKRPPHEADNDEEVECG